MLEVINDKQKSFAANKAYSLLEVVVSLAILAIGLLGSLNLLLREVMHVKHIVVSYAELEKSRGDAN